MCKLIGISCIPGCLKIANCKDYLYGFYALLSSGCAGDSM